MRVEYRVPELDDERGGPAWGYQAAGGDVFDRMETVHCPERHMLPAAREDQIVSNDLTFGGVYGNDR